ncbi:uncharacterized protein [Venturia canescens]|uniref:uncharacterized protein n=1 Tax=Venturia canescens TaxID=32260 RepID=UPI001C9CA4CF|nr:uncharacterized protein LOC122415402 [Venturia canescens]
MDFSQDFDATSIASSEIRSIDSSSTYSAQSSDQKRDRSVIPDDNTAKLSLIEKALNETIAEQDVYSKEITELLGTLDIMPNSLSKNIQEAWNKVALILRAEGLSEVDENLLQLKMEEKKRETAKRACEERKLKSRYDNLCERHRVVLEKQAVVRESTESLQKFVETEWANNEEEYANRIFLATKLNDFRQTAEKLQESLDQQVPADLYPQKLLEKYETYLELLEESKALDKTLEKYGDLPPNLLEARMKLEEKELYLKDLEHTIFEKMNS